ncbi:hypothetical protein SLA2020_514500 [Shorea laevis]
MALLGSNVETEVGLRLLLCPLGSNIVLRTACCSVGIALPVYSTYRAIERNDQNQQQKWLIYWAAYGTFTLVETFSDKLLSWFPLYYHFKFAFLVWLQLPATEGAKQLYRSHLRPFLLRHQARVDQLTGFAYDGMVKLISSHQEEIRFARTIIGKITASADQMLRGSTEAAQSGPRNAIEDQTGMPSESESDHD